MDEINQAIEAAKAELAMLQAEIATLKAKKSIVECRSLWLFATRSATSHLVTSPTCLVCLLCLSVLTIGTTFNRE